MPSAPSADQTGESAYTLYIPIRWLWCSN